MDWNNLTPERKRKLYRETMQDVQDCCDNWEIPFEEADGICKKCGRVTSKGKCVCGCYYSSVECDNCGAAPCDKSC